MKTNFTYKSIILSFLLVLSSCGTVKYSDKVHENDYGNLLSGKKYSFGLRSGGSSQKMIFSHTTKDAIVGFASKKDSTQISIPKSDVAAVKDSRKSTSVGVGVGIAAVGVAAIIVSSTRATKNE